MTIKETFGSECIDCLIQLTNDSGYPKLRTGKHHEGNTTAARAVYRMFVGEIPPKMVISHHCDNRRCINPTHLYLRDIRKPKAPRVTRKLTPEDCWYIRRSPLSLSQLAAKFEATVSHLSLVRRKLSGREERMSAHYFWLLLREHISRKGRRQGGAS